MNTRTILFPPLLAAVLLILSGTVAAWEEPGKKYPVVRGKVQARSYFFKEAEKDMGYAVYVPEAYDPKRSWPLIIGLHGLASNPSQLIRYPGFTSLAEKHGYIIACPMGYNTSAWYGAATFVSKRVGKLSEQDAINIRYRLQKGEKAVDLANEYNVSKAHISDIKHYKCWPNAGQPDAVGDLNLPGFDISESELNQNVAAERLEFWERLRTGP